MTAGALCWKINDRAVIEFPNGGSGNQGQIIQSSSALPFIYLFQVILMLMVIVVLFAICWGPILLNNLLVAAKVISDLHFGFLKPMRMAFHLMSYANSCVNPIVYGIMSKNFQDSLKSALKCCNSRQTYRTYVYSTDTTRASILKSSNSEDKDNCGIEMNWSHDLYKGILKHIVHNIIVSLLTFWKCYTL